MFSADFADSTIVFEWKDSYSVQIRSIDGQHRNLFRLAARLHEATSAGDSRAVLIGLLDDLVQYAHVHFQQEERLMQAANYPEFAAHKAEHEAFLRRVNELQEEYQSRRTASGIELLVFLRTWLEQHIMGSDQRYAPYLKVKSAA